MNVNIKYKLERLHLDAYNICRSTFTFSQITTVYLDVSVVKATKDQWDNAI